MKATNIISALLVASVQGFSLEAEHNPKAYYYTSMLNPETWYFKHRAKKYCRSIEDAQTCLSQPQCTLDQDLPKRKQTSEYVCGFDLKTSLGQLYEHCQKISDENRCNKDKFCDWNDDSCGIASSWIWAYPKVLRNMNEKYELSDE